MTDSISETAEGAEDSSVDRPEETGSARSGVAVARIPRSDPPRGIRRADPQGFEVLDAMAGRASVFGFGFGPIVDAIGETAGRYLGDGSAFAGSPSGQDESLTRALRPLLDSGGHDWAAFEVLCASADLAIERAIELARRRGGGQRFRCVALVGSDHGRTGTCMTASGCPELHDGYGPMMPGFAHVAPGDLDALRDAVDEQTASVLLSPVQWIDGCRPLDADYLRGVREICDERELLLLIDETQLMFAGSGNLFTFERIANGLRPDAVIVAGGLFGGLPAGLLVASARMAGNAASDTARFPLSAAVATATLTQLSGKGLLAGNGLPESTDDGVHPFAVALAEQAATFDFVRDIHAVGLTIGIETDVESHRIVGVASERGVRVEASGPTAIRIQPPLTLSVEDQDELIRRLGLTLQAMEHEATEISV